MDDDAKAGFVADVTEHVREVDPGAVDVWVLIDEVRDGNWGADGVVTRLAASQAILTGDKIHDGGRDLLETRRLDRDAKRLARDVEAMPTV